jgi:hypothetical protein
LPVDLKRDKKDYKSDGEPSVSPRLQPVVESSWSMELTKTAGKGRGAGRYWREEKRTSTANEEQSARSSRNTHG